jgi:hypothetical protein
MAVLLPCWLNLVAKSSLVRDVMCGEATPLPRPHERPPIAPAAMPPSRVMRRNTVPDAPTNRRLNLFPASVAG